MAIAMGHCFGHHQRRHCYGRRHDVTSIGKFCPSADIKKREGDGENPNWPIDMFETSESGSHHSIEVAQDCFVVFRSTVDRTVKNLKQRGFYILAFGKDKYAPRIPRLLKCPPDKQKAHRVVSKPLVMLSKNCRVEKHLKTSKGNGPYFFLPITMDRPCVTGHSMNDGL